MAATKLSLWKLVCTINTNVVRDRSYENLSYESFFTRNFQIYSTLSFVAIIFSDSLAYAKLNTQKHTQLLMVMRYRDP